jgi:hypothetical protein
VPGPVASAAGAVRRRGPGDGPSPARPRRDPRSAGPAVRCRFWFAIAIAIAIAAGCSENARPGSRVRIAAFDLDPRQLAGLSVELVAGRTTVVAGGRLTTSDEYAQLHSSWVDVTGDELQVRFAMVVDDVEIATGVLVLEVIEDWEWEVQFHIAATDPAATCMGCQGSQEYALRGDERRLFVVWGGNSRSDPVVW